MSTIAAVIFTDAPDGLRTESADLVSVGGAGLSVTERAMLSAYEAGINRVHVTGRQLPDETSLARLRQRGLDVTATRRKGSPFLDAPAADVLLMMPADAVIEPATLAALIERSNLSANHATLLIDQRPEAPNRLVKLSKGRVTSFLADGDAASTDIAALSPEAVFMVRDAVSARQAYRRLARFGILFASDAAPSALVRVTSTDNAGRTGNESHEPQRVRTAAA